MTSTMRGEQVPFRLARTGAPTQRRRLPAETTLAELVALLLAQALPLPVGLDGTLDAAWCAGDANGPLPGATPLASLGEEPTVHLHRIPARRVRARVRAKHPAGVRTGVLVAHTGVPGASLLEGLLDALDLDGAWTLVHAGVPVGPFDTLASRIGAADDPIDLELVPA
jgi:hypothetical protein